MKEADGTTRVVKYEADPLTGFHATVKRIGHAQHPDNHQSYIKQINYYETVSSLHDEKSKTIDN